MNRINLLKTTFKQIIDLSKKSDILADHRSKLFCNYYLDLKNENKNEVNLMKSELFNDLCHEHGLKVDRVYNKFQSLISVQTKQEFENGFNSIYFERLNMQLRPDYYNLFKSLSRVNNGAKTIVKMREDLLDIIEKEQKSKSVEELKIMNSVLKDLLSLLFSAGSLQLQRITWNSPASLVEKIAHFENVHQIRSLNELKIRLSASRRCFIFTHNSMPYEPLVILHVALTNSISSNILHLLRNLEDIKSEDEHLNATHAIFYSISSCQKGLKNIELGNSLIKGCVNLLKLELPNLKNFHTLSPIPGYRAWLNTKLANNFDENYKKFFIQKFQNLIQLFKIDLNNLKTLENLKIYLNSDEFKQNVFKNSEENDDKTKLCIEFLNSCCAYYLINEKQRGYILNSVCNFHIKNGAILDRINFYGDLTDKGWKNSFSLMVNYTYNLNDLDSNSINYLNEKKFISSDLVKKFI